MLDEKRKPVLTSFGQVKIKHGDQEVRTADKYPDPFPLYPGEVLVGKIEKYVMIIQNQALKLTALRDFKDDQGVIINPSN